MLVLLQSFNCNLPEHIEIKPDNSEVCSMSHLFNTTHLYYAYLRTKFPQNITEEFNVEELTEIFVG